MENETCAEYNVTENPAWYESFAVGNTAPFTDIAGGFDACDWYGFEVTPPWRDLCIARHARNPAEAWASPGLGYQIRADFPCIPVEYSEDVAVMLDSDGAPLHWTAPDHAIRLPGGRYVPVSRCE